MKESDWKSLEETLQSLMTAEKVGLIEKVARSLRDKGRPMSLPRQRLAIRKLRRELAALPVHNPPDSFSNRQHDQVLYGGGS